MKQSTADYLTGATLAAMLIALLVSANYLYGEEPVPGGWIQDGELETRTIKLPGAESQPVRSYGEYAGDWR